MSTYLPTKVMHYHGVPGVGRRVSYTHRHLDSALWAAVKLTHSQARPWYVFATALGYVASKTAPPASQRVIITSLEDDDSVTATMFEPAFD